MNDSTQRAPGTPTVKMLEFAKNIASRLGLQMPDDAMVDFDACRAFIDENKDAAMRPTPKQLAFAERIAKERGIEIPEDALAEGRVLSRWIDENR